MPLYDYECEACKKNFTLVLSLKEHEHPDVRCPGCGSNTVQQLISTFIARTSKKS